MKPSFLFLGAVLFPFVHLLLLVSLQAQTTAQPSESTSTAFRDLRLVQRLQIITQQQEEMIRKATAVMQTGTGLLREAAGMALKNEALLNVLAKNGYNVQPPPGSGAVKPPAVLRSLPAYVPSPVPFPGAEFPDPPKDLSAEVKADYEYLDDLRRKNLVRIRNLKETQAKLEPVFRDLSELAKSDADAQVLVRKYNVLQDAP